MKERGLISAKFVITVVQKKEIYSNILDLYTKVANLINAAFVNTVFPKKLR